jgi:hypothetical protein
MAGSDRYYARKTVTVDNRPFHKTDPVAGRRSRITYDKAISRQQSRWEGARMANLRLVPVPTSCTLNRGMPKPQLNLLNFSACQTA